MVARRREFWDAEWQWQYILNPFQMGFHVLQSVIFIRRTVLYTISLD